LDQVLQMSLKASVLDRQFLQISDLSPGDILMGRIKKVTDKAMFLSISGTVDAVIWPNHFADISLRHPQKRFKEKSLLKCKVN
jgi:rRNA biogenesis protein RRP5